MCRKRRGSLCIWPRGGGGGGVGGWWEGYEGKKAKGPWRLITKEEKGKGGGFAWL